MVGSPKGSLKFSLEHSLGKHVTAQGKHSFRVACPIGQAEIKYFFLSPGFHLNSDIIEFHQQTCKLGQGIQQVFMEETTCLTQIVGENSLE